MPPSSWQKAKKEGATQHFNLVFRPQNDPKINDDSAPSMVLNPTPGSSKIKKLNDLASELGSEAESIRDNEGEAANYGVFYDDTEYDYMQHMRDLGTGAGESVFVEAQAPQPKSKGKQKQSLESALRQMELEQKSGDLFDEDMLPSKDLPRMNYQSQQDVPDSIAGFQPDMDPRLREVLEALEDDAYVDDDDDIFQALAKDAKELQDHEFDETYDGFDDDGWESDGTAKPRKEYTDDEVPTLVDTAAVPAQGPSEEWLEDFKKFKKDQKSEKKPAGLKQADGLSSIWTTTTTGGRTKKRKGALTNPSAYSMTSSSLVRTEQMNILDARFEKMEERYNDMEEEGSVVSGMTGMTGMSSVQGAMRQDFDGILDEFLGNHRMQGKRRVKRGKDQTGLQQLDEIRRGLGPARIQGRHA